jgi:hypothetical protein
MQPITMAAAVFFAAQTKLLQSRQDCAFFFTKRDSRAHAERFGRVELDGTFVDEMFVRRAGSLAVLFVCLWLWEGKGWRVLAGFRELFLKPKT